MPFRVWRPPISVSCPAATAMSSGCLCSRPPSCCAGWVSVRSEMSGLSESPLSLFLRVSCSPGERRVALTQNDQLLDFMIDRPGRPDGFGDMYRGRVIARVSAMAGAFVALPDGAEGFLPDSACHASLPKTGEPVFVRVTRSASGGKGPRLATIPAPAHDMPEGASPLLLHRGPTGLDDLAVAFPGAIILVDNHAVFASLRPIYGERVRMAVEPVWDEALQADIAALVTPDALLPGGAMLHVQPTAALVALDVDAGSASAARDSKNRAQMQINHAILPSIARQIRLRNLSGAILLDLAGVQARKRPSFAAPLTEALAEDPLHPRLHGFTALGFAEISRQRLRPPLHEMLQGPHAAALAVLRQGWRWSIKNPGRQPSLRLSPAVHEALSRDSSALEEFRHETGLLPILISDPALRGDRAICPETD
ncbi:Ribonuclease E [Granulibacter bethesdensis]|nr:Ribonuclease E [Granulibacter bethesdensis]